MISIILYSIYGDVFLQLTQFSCDDHETCTLSYHYQIKSMNHLPLFKVRLWNNGKRCVLLYCYHITLLLGTDCKFINLDPSPSKFLWLSMIFDPDDVIQMANEILRNIAAFRVLISGWVTTDAVVCSPPFRQPLSSNLKRKWWTYSATWPPRASSRPMMTCAVWCLGITWRRRRRTDCTMKCSILRNWAQ